MREILPEEQRNEIEPFGYTPDKDVVRAPMMASTLPWSVDQLTWEFTDMTDAGGKIMIMWDKTAASVPFKVGM